MTLFNFDFQFLVPFGKYKIIFSRHGKIPFTKWDIEFVLAKKRELILIKFYWYIMEGHSAFENWFSLFGYSVELNIYDSRHYDYENHCWI